MKKFLTIAAIALFATCLGQNITHATSKDSMTWIGHHSKGNGIFQKSDYFYHNNEWVYVDITNTGKEVAPLRYFGADVKNGTDDGFTYTVDKEHNLIVGVENYRKTVDKAGTCIAPYYSQISGHDYLAPGETAHIKLKVGATSGFSSASATTVRGVFYQCSATDDDHSIGDGAFAQLDYDYSVHFWTDNDGWDGAFNVRY